MFNTVLYPFPSLALALSVKDIVIFLISVFLSKNSGEICTVLHLIFYDMYIVVWCDASFAPHTYIYICIYVCVEQMQHHTKLRYP